MSFINVNAPQTVKQNQHQPVSAAIESNTQAFQKVLEKQLNHADLQKKRDETAKAASDKTRKDASNNASDNRPANAETQDDQAKLILAQNLLAKNQAAKGAQQKTTRTSENQDQKTRLNEKAYAENKLKNKPDVKNLENKENMASSESVKDKLDLVDVLTVGEDLAQALSLTNSATLTQDQIQNQASNANRETQQPEQAANVTNALLPMLNIMQINSTIQSKLDQAAPALENSLDKISAGLTDAKSSELTVGDQLAKKNATDIVADIDIAEHQNRQTGFSQSLAESINQQSTLNQQSIFHEDAEVKLSNSLNISPISAHLSAPAMVNMANSTQAVMSNEIAPMLGGHQWNEAIGKKIIWMVGAEQQSATLTLNPPDLGPLQVVIQVQNQQVDASFISQNPEVRQALQDGLDNLRDMMTNSGIQLGQANVHSDQQAQQNSQQNAQRSAQSAFNQNATSNNAQPTASNASPNIFVSNGLVDTFA